MFREELQQLIRKIQNKIEKRKNELKKKEKDYEELLNLKNGFDRIMEQFWTAQEKDKVAMQSELFEKNHCMQRFRDGMLDQLSEHKSCKPFDSIMMAIESVNKTVSTTKNDIYENESELEDLKAKLRLYKTQILSAVSMTDNGGNIDA